MHITHSLMNFLRNSLIQLIDKVYFTEKNYSTIFFYNWLKFLACTTSYIALNKRIAVILVADPDILKEKSVQESNVSSSAIEPLSDTTKAPMICQQIASKVQCARSS